MLGILLLIEHLNHLTDLLQQSPGIKTSLKIQEIREFYASFLSIFVSSPIYGILLYALLDIHSFMVHSFIH